MWSYNAVTYISLAGMRREAVLVRTRARSGSFIAALGVAAAVIVAAGAPAAFGEERTIRALSPMTAQGLFFETGENRALFLGAVHGVLYVESGADTLDGATIVCPASFSIDALSPAYTADGYCTIGRSDTDKVFARWNCQGAWSKGCRGRLTISGGTGRFAGITGEGELVMRLGRAEFIEPPREQRGGIGVVRELGAGLLSLPAFRYRLP